MYCGEIVCGENSFFGEFQTNDNIDYQVILIYFWGL